MGLFSLAVGRCTCRCSVGTLVAERLLYIPSIGYCMLVGDAVRALVHRPAPLSVGSVRLRLATQATLLALLTLAFTHTRSAWRAAAAQMGARGLPVVNQWPGRSTGYCTPWGTSDTRAAGQHYREAPHLQSAHARVAGR